MSSESAGLLMYRCCMDGLEVLLAHPGGPFWASKDAGAWTLPKGALEGDEPLEAAVREFREETGFEPTPPFLELGAVTQKAGKKIHAWAFEGNADPAQMRSNLVMIEWPPRSGRRLQIPEVDRCEWFPATLAKFKINPAQAELIDRLLNKLQSEP